MKKNIVFLILFIATSCLGIESNKENRKVGYQEYYGNCKRCHGGLCRLKTLTIPKEWDSISDYETFLSTKHKNTDTEIEQYFNSQSFKKKLPYLIHVISITDEDCATGTR